MSEVLLEARGLGFALPGREILADVSLAVRAGEALALLGPNGSGKTTLLRCLTGVLRPSSGEVRLLGSPLAARSRPEIACQIAYLPQNTWTDFDLSVFDAVAMGRFPHRGAFRALTPGDRDAVHAAMAQLGIEPLARRTLPTLSAGERQRVFLARALAQGSPLLVLDEPTAALDIGHQLELVEILARLHAEGKTIVAALHDLRLAWESFPRAVVLDRGRVRADGAAREVLLAPETGAAFGIEVRSEGSDLRVAKAALERRGRAPLGGPPAAPTEAAGPRPS